MMKRLLRVLLLFALVFPEAALADPGNPRNLLVTVLQTADVNEVRALLSLQVNAANTGAERLPVTVYSGRRYPDKNSSRQLQVLEGRTAFIHVGYAEPEVQLLWIEADGDHPLPNIGLASRERINGFTVTAELAGERVILEVQHYDESSQAIQELATTVSGRIGQWLDLGGSLVLEEIPAGVQTYSVSNGRNGQMRVLVKVELAE